MAKKENQELNHKFSKEQLRLLMKNKGNIKAAFGIVKLKMPTQEAMDEIDEGYD